MLRDTRVRTLVGLVGIGLCQGGFLLLIKSEWLSALLGKPFMGTLHYGAEPMHAAALIMIVITFIVWTQGVNAQVSTHNRQYVWGVRGAVMVVVGALVLTHFGDWYGVWLQSGDIGTDATPTVAAAVRYTWLMMLLIPMAFLWIPVSVLRQYKSIFLFGVIALAGYMWLAVLRITLHDVLAPTLLHAAYAVLQLMSGSTAIEPDTLRLQAGEFRAYIGPPCLGLDSAALLLFLWSFVWFQKAKQGYVSHVLMGSMLLGGLLTLALLNVVRIAVLMVVGSTSPELAVDLFHSAIGGVLFLVVFIVMLQLSRHLSSAK